MFPINFPESQYVVSLDSLDLTFLKQYIDRSTDNKRVLWSKPALDGEFKYYKVELESEEVECDSSYIEPFESIMCYICNIDVPQAYFTQHCKSTTHQSYKRLTDMVLQNVSKQLNIKQENTNTNCQNEMFYCETCSKVVLLKNKRKHNKTAYHLQSKKNEKNMNIFLELYCNNQSRIGSDINNKNKQTHNNKAEMNKDNIYSECNTDSDSECSSDEYNTKNEVSSLNKSTIMDSNNCNTEDIIFQNKIMAVSATKSLQFNLDDFIHIETPKGYKEKVKLRCFHGFIESNNVLYCKLCDKMVLKEHLQDHNKSTKHSSNITQPVNDDFIRKLVNEMSHCVLCNIITSPNSNHQEDLFHKMHIASILPVEIDPETNSNETFCDVCHKYIHTHNFLSHTKGQKHKVALMQMNCNQSEKKLLLTDTVTNSNHTVNKKQYCDICKIYVTNDSIQIHESQNDHIENMRKVLDNTSTSSNVASEVKLKQRAGISKAIISPKNKHVLINTKKLNEYKKQMIEWNTTQMKCLICYLYVPNSVINIIEHVEGSNHTTNLTDLLSLNKISKKAGKIYYCSLCDININDFVAHIKENVDHKIKLMSSRIIDKGKLIEYVYQDPANNSTMAFYFRELYKDLLIINNITIDKEYTLFFCNVCSIELMRITEINHMLGERHARNLNISS